MKVILALSIPIFLTTTDVSLSAVHYCGWSAGVLKLEPTEDYSSIKLESSNGDVPTPGTYVTKSATKEGRGNAHAVTITHENFVYEIFLYKFQNFEEHHLDWRNTDLNSGQQFSGSGVCFTEESVK